MEIQLCSFCDKPAINVSIYDLYSGCEKHKEKATEETAIELRIIGKIGFDKWLLKKPRIKTVDHKINSINAS